MLTNDLLLLYFIYYTSYPRSEHQHFAGFKWGHTLPNNPKNHRLNLIWYNFKKEEFNLYIGNGTVTITIGSKSRIIVFFLKQTKQQLGLLVQLTDN